MKLENRTDFDAVAFPGMGPGDKTILTVVVKGTFKVMANGDVQPAVEQIPISYADEMSELGETRFESDLAPFKPRADVLLQGKAYAPYGTPTRSVDVTLNIGPVHKTLRVVGDRNWDVGGLLGNPTPSTAQPFSQMELCYARAYGGIDSANGGACAENPIGQGCIADKAKKKTVAGRVLPNIENPAALIAKTDDRPLPVGFGPVGKGWNPRVKHLGTYDEKWKAERAPKLPEDCSFEFYNIAPPDQQIDGYLRGGETIELTNLTPNGRLITKVPRVPLQAALTRRHSQTSEPVAMKLDTLYVLPDEKCLIVIWRGVCLVGDALASDIERVEISDSQ